MSERVIIDTDPGYDDAFAIFLALASPELEIVALTTVAGNVPLGHTTANARRIVELAGRGEIPVYAGADRPLLRTPRYAPEVHGESGVDGYDWAAPARPPEPDHAVDWMLRTLATAAERSLTVVALGPLTNLALLLRRAPEVAARIARIVLMGGGYFAGGNITPAAEFNIFVDPEAAAIVFGAGVELVAMPLDCTAEARVPAGWAAALAACGTRVGAACAGMLAAVQATGVVVDTMPTRALHDALAIGFMLWPDLFEGRRCNVAIETSSELTRGATVVDWRGRTGRPANCFWIRTCADPATLYQRMAERIAKLP